MVYQLEEDVMVTETIFKLFDYGEVELYQELMTEFRELNKQMVALVNDELEGDVSNIFNAPKHVTERYNQINVDVFSIHNEAQAKLDQLQFIRDSKGRFTEANMYIGLDAGWYQDIDGRLYKYDGVVWDIVPGCKLADLEYLG
jgi:hypothetical protein